MMVRQAPACMHPKWVVCLFVGGWRFGPGNFALYSAVSSLVDISLYMLRGKSDLWSKVLVGTLTGGLLSIRSLHFLTQICAMHPFCRNSLLVGNSSEYDSKLCIFGLHGTCRAGLLPFALPLVAMVARRDFEVFCLYQHLIANLVKTWASGTGNAA